MRGPVVNMARRAVALGMSTLVAVGACASSGPTSARPGASAAPVASVTVTRPADEPHRGAVLAVGRSAWVSVSVATLWRTPQSPRPVDAPALERPAAIEQWLDDMTTAERRALNGRADTQALLGDRVVVLALPASSPAWAKVAVPSQPSPLGARGYPGWVPRRQLTARVPDAAPRRATVVTRLAWLRADTTEASPLLRISFGTSLPVAGTTRRFVRVVTPAGATRRLAGSAVSVHDADAPALPASRSSLVQTAKLFLGLPYLWAGASGFGLDCSGLTWLDHRVHDLRIPRDASPQSQHGRGVARLRPGDLMFYATDGTVHHVSMYVGHGRMVHSPGTGQRVQVIPTSTPSYAEEYAGARRYLR